MFTFTYVTNIIRYENKEKTKKTKIFYKLKSG